MPYDRATASAASRSIGAYCAPAASYTVTIFSGATWSSRRTSSRTTFDGTMTASATRAESRVSVCM